MAFGPVSIGGSSYVLPPATADTLGGVVIGDNLTVDEQGKVNLPVAAATALGGIKSGKGLKISADGTASIDAYNTAETDAMLDELQEQLSKTRMILAKPIYYAKGEETQTVPDNVDYVVLSTPDSQSMEDSNVRILTRGQTVDISSVQGGSGGDTNCTNRITFAKNGTLNISVVQGWYRFIRNIVGFHYEATATMPCAVEIFSLKNKKNYIVSDNIDYIEFKLDNPVLVQDPNAFLLARGGSYVMGGVSTYGSLTFKSDGTISFNCDQNDHTINAISYHYTTPTELNNKLTAAESALADADALNLDQDYRLTLLELGVTDDETTA